MPLPLRWALIAVPLLAAACDASAEKARAKASASAPGTEETMLRQRGRVTIRTREGLQIGLDVEIASDDRERARGLMFRRTLPEMAGMIFVFPGAPEVHSFWMKNTLLPLDMLFIDEGGAVVGIVESAEPLTTHPRDVGRPSVRVLEVNGGWCRRHGVAPGDRVALQGQFDLR
jgi:uncharacterized protein